MFHLAQGIYRNWNKREQYSVLILGLDNAGKSTFLEQLKSIYRLSSRPLEKIVPTVGQNVATIPVDKNTLLKFWDVGGQEALRAMWSEYYIHAHGIIFIIDSSDKYRLEECCDSLQKTITDDDIEGIPIIMLANKQDREDKMELHDIKQVFNKLAQHLDARDSRVLPVSALNGEGIASAVEWLLIRIKRNKRARPPVYR
ncbi:HHL183Cp [Eremothecium sinecaudum]|uniref:HHL183Cp n=1 Tax=Eremothecium sinecaudum TaxID=45286 RepID=A0A0X8HW65_9SACH|nr:HHL183Cp [Eremothecium sinecaudum]AMD22587.1 HHL183Cp [Eremothecium sinecaudum]